MNNYWDSFDCEIQCEEVYSSEIAELFVSYEEYESFILDELINQIHD